MGHEHDLSSEATLVPRASTSTAIDDLDVASERTRPLGRLVPPLVGASPGSPGRARLRPGEVLFLQRTVGNRTVSRALTDRARPRTTPVMRQTETLDDEADDRLRSLPDSESLVSSDPTVSSPPPEPSGTPGTPPVDDGTESDILSVPSSQDGSPQSPAPVSTQPPQPVDQSIGPGGGNLPTSSEEPAWSTQPATSSPASSDRGDAVVPEPTPAPSIGPEIGPADSDGQPTQTGSIDWENFFADNSGIFSGIRIFGEITRPIPLVGIFTGLLADTINVGQDLEALSNADGFEDAPFTSGVVVLRDVVNLGGNVISGLKALDQTVQNVLAGSVVGAEFVPVTAAIHEFLGTVEGVKDGAVVVLDILGTAGARYNQANAPTPEKAAAWNGIYRGFAANTIADITGTIIDFVDFCSGGAANGENLERVVKSLKVIVGNAKTFKRVVVHILRIWMGVRGGDDFGGPLEVSPSLEGASVNRQEEGSGSVGELAEDISRAAILREIAQIRQAHTIGDHLLTMAAEGWNEAEMNLRRVGAELMDGQDPFIVMRDSMNKMIGDLTSSISGFSQMGVFATDVQVKSEALSGFADDALAGLDSLQMPEVHIPRVVEDDGILADIANAPGAAVEMLLRRALQEVGSGLETVKSTAAAPFNLLKENAEELAEFSQFVQDEVQGGIASANEHLEVFNDGLAQCGNFTDIASLVLRTVTRAAGMDEPIDLDTVREWWDAIPGMLDRAEAWASGSGPARPRDEPQNEVPDISAESPEPPQEPDESDVVAS